MCQTKIGKTGKGKKEAVEIVSNLAQWVKLKKKLQLPNLKRSWLQFTANTTFWEVFTKSQLYNCVPGVSPARHQPPGLGDLVPGLADPGAGEAEAEQREDGRHQLRGHRRPRQPAEPHTPQHG